MYVIAMLALFLLLALVIHIIRTPRKFRRQNAVVDVCVVMGPGGHCMEMCRYCSGMPPGFRLAYFLVAKSDYLTISKITKVMKNREDHYEIIEITRPRRVKQPIFTSIFTTLLTLFQSLYIFSKIRPDMLLCNGPALCVPPSLVIYLMQKLNLIPSFPIVFVESFCRVKTLSLSGKIMYNIADAFIVQWLELKKVYERATYLGRLL